MASTIATSLNSEVQICSDLFKDATASETLRRQTLSQYQLEEFTESMQNEWKRLTEWSNDLFRGYTGQNPLLHILECSFSYAETISTLLSELEAVLLEGPGIQ
ncbi:hypothetical protein N7530_009799 [Penicillium desertorum]|uniref:Uncharacterized protein n=1 Tax=Penicillium desertorum TaxID=1303715 RepID=A0A9W9WJS4_9EURO|nr:hypothetical protein N7530_009799 [Penicillium desertorum]